MGLFGSSHVTYKGHDIYEDKENGVWIIRKGGRYGIKVAEALDLKTAKRLVDELM